MEISTSSHICIATLGGQPQVVTLALDRLLAQDYPISELILVHLAASSNSRYQRAIQQIAGEFPDDNYVHTLPSQQCRFRTAPIVDEQGPIRDLDTPAAMSATQRFLYDLLYEVRRPEQTLHLCISGGRRLLGYLLLTLAPMFVRSQDRIWQLISSDAIREQTRDGAQLHVPDTADVHLIQLPSLHLVAVTGRPAPSVDHNPIETVNQQLDAIQLRRCQRVWSQLNDQHRSVLRQMLMGKPRRFVAQDMGLSVATIDEYFTTIYAACSEAWELVLPHRKWEWLWEQFHPYLRYL